MTVWMTADAITAKPSFTFRIRVGVPLENGSLTHFGPEMAFYSRLPDTDISVLGRTETCDNGRGEE